MSKLMQRLEELINLYPINRERDTQDRLLKKIEELVLLKGSELDWGSRSVDRYKVMSKGIFDEMFNSTCSCKTDKRCGPDYVCKKCKGTGIRIVNKSRRARLMGISRVSYGNIWHSRWELVSDIIKSLKKA